MKLLGNRLHVAPVMVDRVGSVIVLPESLQADHLDSYRLFRVLAVGPGRKTKNGAVVPIECEPGDRVICHSHTTGPQPLKDGTLIITGDQVLAVMKPFTLS